MSKSDVHDFSSCLELILAAGAVPHLHESPLSLISPRTISRFWVPVRCLESSDLQVTSLTTRSLRDTLTQPIDEARAQRATLASLYTFLLMAAVWLYCTKLEHLMFQA